MATDSEYYYGLTGKAKELFSSAFDIISRSTEYMKPTEDSELLFLVHGEPKGSNWQTRLESELRTLVDNERTNLEQHTNLESEGLGAHASRIAQCVLDTVRRQFNAAISSSTEPSQQRVRKSPQASGIADNHQLDGQADSSTAHSEQEPTEPAAASDKLVLIPGPGLERRTPKSDTTPSAASIAASFKSSQKIPTRQPSTTATDGPQTSQRPSTSRKSTLPREAMRREYGSDFCGQQLNVFTVASRLCKQLMAEEKVDENKEYEFLTNTGNIKRKWHDRLKELLEQNIKNDSKPRAEEETWTDYCRQLAYEVSSQASVENMPATLNDVVPQLAPSSKAQASKSSTAKQPSKSAAPTTIETGDAGSLKRKEILELAKEEVKKRVQAGEIEDTPHRCWWNGKVIQMGWDVYIVSNLVGLLNQGTRPQKREDLLAFTKRVISLASDSAKRKKEQALGAGEDTLPAIDNIKKSPSTIHSSSSGQAAAPRSESVAGKEQIGKARSNPMSVPDVQPGDRRPEKDIDNTTEFKAIMDVIDDPDGGNIYWFVCTTGNVFPATRHQLQEMKVRQMLKEEKSKGKTGERFSDTTLRISAAAKKFDKDLFGSKSKQSDSKKDGKGVGAAKSGKQESGRTKADEDDEGDSNSVKPRKRKRSAAGSSSNAGPASKKPASRKRTSAVDSDVDSNAEITTRKRGMSAAEKWLVKRMKENHNRIIQGKQTKPPDTDHDSGRHSDVGEVHLKLFRIVNLQRQVGKLIPATQHAAQARKAQDELKKCGVDDLDAYEDKLRSLVLSLGRYIKKQRR